MKFLCDRCKTRYSIGDDRVRGKILKIRCKNCANVITVREGMSADEPGVSAASGRQKKMTTASPPVIESAPANGRNALGAAFASAMTKPPPALEEEWYVSIDGDQSGPFSLAEAQRWVAQKAFDAELYCWSEGFDDWLPVDKVSHFRGLRKKPLAPPPLPRITPAPGRAGVAAAAAAAVEDEPKPLFAATMASLEKSVQPSNPALQIPSIKPTPATSARATPASGTPILAKANGAPQLAKGSATSGAVRSATKPGAGVGGSPAAAFDASELADSATQIESPPFEDELATAAEPVAARRADPFLRSTPGPAARANAATAKKAERSPAASDAAITTPHMPSAATTPNGKPATADEDIDGDGELDIGEVSRVVNLADLARSVPRGGDRAQPASARRSGPIPGAVGRLTNSNPSLAGTASVPRIVPPDLAADAQGGEPGQALAPQMVDTSHRRGMIMLLSVAGVLLLGVVGAVILLLSTDDDTTNNNLPTTYVFDPTRPEDPITHRPIETPTSPFNPTHPTNPTRPWRPGTSVGTNQHGNPEEPLPGNSIRADEIEDVARKYQGTTQRCYLRAQRGANAILIGEVKKISVTLTIDKEGSVSNLQLSDHAGDDLGKCLTASIRGWKFRTSPGGTFKFSLNFVDG